MVSLPLSSVDLAHIKSLGQRITSKRNEQRAWIFILDGIHFVLASYVIATSAIHNSCVALSFWLACPRYVVAQPSMKIHMLPVRGHYDSCNAIRPRNLVFESLPCGSNRGEVDNLPFCPIPLPRHSASELFIFCRRIVHRSPLAMCRCPHLPLVSAVISS